MNYFTTGDNTRIYYHTVGFDHPGSTIIFLNGTAQTWVYWMAFANALKARYRVVLYDARGQGRSGMGPEGLSVQHHTDDLTALMAHLKVDTAYLIGLSHGAYIAYCMAARSSHLVDGVVLCSLSVRREPKSQALIHSWLEILDRGGMEALAWAMPPVVFGSRFLEAKTPFLEKMVDTIVQRTQAEGLQAHLRALKAYPSIESIDPRPSCPVLVISGDEDLLVPAKGARRLADLCRADHHLLPNTGHTIPAEAPDLFLKLIQDFLAATLPSTPLK